MLTRRPLYSVWPHLRRMMTSSLTLSTVLYQHTIFSSSKRILLIASGRLGVRTDSAASAAGWWAWATKWRLVFWMWRAGGTLQKLTFILPVWSRWSRCERSCACCYCMKSWSRAALIACFGASRDGKAGLGARLYSRRSPRNYNGIFCSRSLFNVSRWLVI